MSNQNQRALRGGTATYPHQKERKWVRLADRLPVAEIEHTERANEMNRENRKDICNICVS